MRPIIDFLDKHTWLKKKWGDLVTLNYGKRLQIIARKLVRFPCMEPMALLVYT
jgi:hypothetical protein